MGTDSVKHTIKCKSIGKRSKSGGPFHSDLTWSKSETQRVSQRAIKETS